MFSELFGLLVPNRCVCCRLPISYGQRLFCLSCIFDLPLYSSSVIESSEVAKLFFSINAKTISSFFVFNKCNKVQKILHAIKYSKNKLLAYECGINLAVFGLQSIYNDIDLIIPIPLHYMKQKRRGYNQSELIAMGISYYTKVDTDFKTVKRVVNTSTQTTKNRDQRAQNVDNIFEVFNKNALKEKSILLVDDVVTTGATLASCADVLWQSGIKELHVATVAIAV